MVHWLMNVLLPALLTSVLYNGNTNERMPEITSNLEEVYDFIIVGAGSAGSVIASRLSEVASARVLLLEAGEHETAASDVPIFAGYLQQTEMDWQYKTEPQKLACLAMIDGRCNWPRGKVLGGSSVLNYMLYVRGNSRDYDSWEQMGNEGWGYQQVLPYFIKSEDNQNPTLANSTYHGTGGYLTVMEAPWRTPLAKAFVRAGVELGYHNRDFNGANQTGFMVPQGTLRRGSRCSTAKAFLRPVSDRENLHIATGAYTTKILIDPKAKAALGVEFVRDGVKQRVFASKEVILSAGAVNSPQILMLSGVGPKEELEKHQIPLIADLSVGFNLQDHISAGGLVFKIKPKVSLLQYRFENLHSIFKYAAHGAGPLTVMGGIEAIAFVNTPLVNPSLDWPDIEFHLISGNPASFGGETIRKIHGLKKKTWKKFYKPLLKKDTWSVYPMLLRPESRGRITLRSASPFDAPVIDPNYLSSEKDLKTLVEGLKIGYKLSHTKVMGMFGSELYAEPMPGCEDYAMMSDAYLACLTRHYTATIYHPAGTVKMGPRTDREAVVDPQLRVYGIKNLRVADASIMPTVVSGNTNAPVIMIGEKVSDMIKQHWFAETS